jgi:hypothetical protein
MDVWALVRRARFDKHAHDDAEKSRQFGHASNPPIFDRVYAESAELLTSPSLPASMPSDRWTLLPQP